MGWPRPTFALGACTGTGRLRCCQEASAQGACGSYSARWKAGGRSLRRLYGTKTLMKRKITGKPGRPPALTTALKAEICDRVALGETVRQIAADPRMPAESTIYLTLSRDSEFGRDYARAREIQCYSWEDEILEIADGTAGDWTTREARTALRSRSWTRSTSSARRSASPRASG